MASYTDIQWCDSTVNPTMGCDGCELWNKSRKTCYAGMLHRRFGGVTPGYAPTFEQVTIYPGRMAEAAAWSDLTGTKRMYESKHKSSKPWLDKLPRLIFVSDMSDALSAVVKFDYLFDEVTKNVTSDTGKRHHWLWLTKRPERMSQFDKWQKEKHGIEWPDNLWAGTSITTQSSTGRIDSLLSIGSRSTIHFLSVEPQWEEININKWLPRLSWVIQGGESGSQAKPFDVSWAKGLAKKCKQHKVPYFLKQLGSKVINSKKTIVDAHGGDWKEWEKGLRIRQFPILSCPKKNLK